MEHDRAHTKGIRYADLKPYAFPDSLEDLHGPAHGSVDLPHYVLWSPGSKVIRVDDHDGRIRAYQAVLSEATIEDVCRFVNRELLIDIWPELNLPIQVAKGWEARFSVLRGNMRASW